MQKPFFSTVEYFPPSSCKVCFSSFAVALTSPPNPFFFQRSGKVPLGFRSVADVATQSCFSCSSLCRKEVKKFKPFFLFSPPNVAAALCPPPPPPALSHLLDNLSGGSAWGLSSFSSSFSSYTSHSLPARGRKLEHLLQHHLEKFHAASQLACCMVQWPCS